MGVEYSTTVGYGFIIPEEEWEKLEGFDQEEEFFPEHLSDIIYPRFDKLNDASYGNAWSGNNLGSAVVVTSTTTELRESGGAKRIERVKLSLEEMRQLETAYRAVYGANPDPDSFGYYVLDYVF